MNLIPTILCGGSGSRLWPESREMHPKPFIRFGDGESLLQKAILRGATLPHVKNLMIGTNRELLFKIEDEIKDLDQIQQSITFILEPCGRNTAAAIASASLQTMQTYGKEAVLLVLPADHIIKDQVSFAEAVKTAAELAEKGNLVTFGIKPDSPEIGYGYIEGETDASLCTSSGIGLRVTRFVEKPTLAKAQEYLESGRFFWNSGMFCFTAGTMLEQMEQHCPEIVTTSRECLERSAHSQARGFTKIELDDDSFNCVPEDSIDFAVMEKSDNMVVVPCEIGWSDIGSWSEFGDLTLPDTNSNRIEGEAIVKNSKNCYVKSNGNVVAAVGVENLIIVDTADALLVADKGSSQEVKKVFEDLKRKGHDAYKFHRTISRPWGTYTVLDEGKLFKVKRIEVKPGAMLSLQKHHHRCEHWVIVQGTAKVINGDRELILKRNESTYIQTEDQHRLENIGKDLLVLVEVQVGNYLGEDDIVRLQDVYGRVS